MMIARILLAISLLGMSAAWGAETQKAMPESVQKLVALMHMDSMISNMRDQMKKVMAQVAERESAGKLDAEEQAVLSKYMDKFGDLMIGAMSEEKFKQMVVSIYQDNFTEKEILDMIAFYGSDTGRSMIAKMPAIMQSSTKFAMDMMASARPQMDELMKQMQSELTAIEQRKKKTNGKG